MSEYIKNKKDMKFQSHEALRTVQSVIDDADKALNDKSRRMSDSPIQEVLVGALGTGVGAGVGFAGLYFGGSVAGLSAAGITSGLAAAGGIIGGGMAAGVAVLAAPAAILGAGGVAIAYNIKYKKLIEEKELLYETAIKKQNAIIEALKKERKADKERIKYLTSLNLALQKKIEDLAYDLGKN